MENKKLSQTMRIDLIPDIPADRGKSGKEHVSIATPTRRHKRVHAASRDQISPDQKYEELLQSLYDATVIADIEGRIVDVNARTVEFLLYESEELKGMSMAEIISGADATLINTLHENLENERFTLIFAYCIRKDGSYFPAEIAVNELDLGTKHLCFFIRDTTLRRQAEEMLRTEHNAIQNSGNGIAITGLDASIEYVNPAVLKMWEYDDVAELVGMSVCALINDPSSAADIVGAVMESQQSWQGELKGRNKKGQEFDVQVSIVCNRNSEGESVGTVISFTDISDRKRAEEAMREAERHKVMLESLGAACHHLGQPATVLLANLGIMQKKVGGGDSDLQELVATSIEAAEALGAILHRLNAVNEYRTTLYLERADDDSMANRILEI